MALKINKHVFFAVKLSVSSALLYYVLSRAGISKVVDTIMGISPFAFVSAILIYISAQVISTYRWSLLLPEKYPFKRLFWLYMLGSFFNTFLPGLVGGDAVKAYYLYKERGKGTQSLASVFMDRYLGFVSLMLIGITAFPFGFVYFKGSWVEWALPAIVFTFAVGSFIVFGLRIGNRFKILGGLYEYFHEYARNKSLIIKVIAISLVIQTLTIISVYILSLGLGFDIGLLAFFVFVPLITSIATIPISISGIGLREATFVTLFGFIGVNAVSATALSFAWFLSITFGGLLGIVEYLRKK